MTTDSFGIYTALVGLITRKIPNFEVRYKNENTIQRILGVLLTLFNSAYMTEFTTTFYPKVYFPSWRFVTDNADSAWRVLAHEYVHLCDNRDSPLGFRARYLLPQLLGVFATLTFLAMWTPWAWLFVVFFAFFAPWPSSGRTAIELRGYTMSMAVDFWTYGAVPSGDQLEWVISEFTGWGYYRMGGAGIRDLVAKAADSIVSGEILTGPGSEPYADVYRMLTALNAVRIARA